MFFTKFNLNFNEFKNFVFNPCMKFFPQKTK